MNKWIVLMGLLLTGCVTLPGAERVAERQFQLPWSEGDCEPGSRQLALSLIAAAPGLGTSHLWRRDASSGELQKLANVRWAAPQADMIRQRLAKDLECRGFAVSSNHQRSAGQQRLNCELRDMVVQRGAGGDHALLSLSCQLLGKDRQSSFRASASNPLNDWNAIAAVRAMGQSYEQVLGRLQTFLNQH